MADFVLTNAGWVNANRPGHGRFASKVTRGDQNGTDLLEVVEAKVGMTGTPVGFPDWAWVDLPDVDPANSIKVLNHQVDTVIEVDSTCALVIGWAIQVQEGDGRTPTHSLSSVQRWQHLMWAIDSLGNPGPAVELGYRMDYNWDSDDEPDYQNFTDYGMLWPAHFGIGMGSRRVRLPSEVGTADLVVAVSPELVISFPNGPIPVGYSGPDLGNAALGDPNTQNGVMAHFEPGVSPAAGKLRFADGTVSDFTGPGTPLCQPVDLGANYWAWLTDDGGTLKLAYYQLGSATTADPLELPEWAGASPKVTYTLSRLTNPATSLFAVMRVRHDPDLEPLDFFADQILCTFAGPRALTGWTNIRTRTDQFEYPS